MTERSLEELRRVTERTRMFSPFGLGGMIDEISSARYIQALVAETELRETVPDQLRNEFEAVRALHVYGLFVYEFFTVAARHSFLVIEAALQHRFMRAHGAGVTLVHRSKPPVHFQIAEFDALQDHLAPRGPHPARQGWGLECFPEFDGRLRSLFRWARSRGLLQTWLDPVWERALPGLVMTEGSRSDASRRIPEAYASWSPEERERWWRTDYRPDWELGYIENTIALRNLAGHPDPGSVLTPITSATSIEHLAAILNSLFGPGT